MSHAMAHRYVCSACMRGLRQQPAETQAIRFIQSRRLTTSFTRLQAQAYKTPQAQSSTISKSAASTSAKQDQPEVKQEAYNSFGPSIAQTVRERAPSLTETYVAYGTCEILVKECARVAEYTIPEELRKDQILPDSTRKVDVGIGKGWWYEQFDLEASFNTWAQITFLHMWLLTVRLRTFPAAHVSAWHQHLTDHFFYLAEDKMVQLHGLASRSIRNRYLKDLFQQWRGCVAAYDQGLVEGDAMLAAGIWRNIVGAKEDVDLEKLAQVTAYVRGALKGLENINDEDIATGQVVFEDPAGEKSLVAQKSRLWDQPIDSGVQGAAVSAPPMTGKWRKAPQGTVIKGAAISR